VYEAIGRAFYLGDKPGSAQTMKLVNKLLAATGLIATCEAVAMGVKSGLDAATMIEVLNAGSGGTNASRDKFPRSILPRTFDYGFATGLMVKDVRLYVAEAKALGVSMEVAEAVARLWETVNRELGPGIRLHRGHQADRTGRGRGGGRAAARLTETAPPKH
jgi:3-hydroxyisobutyrate dehydrogenase-like beta-hydroxyacid dehydrogenase